MAFYCNDCSYRGKTSGQGGQCPACGSFNVSSPRIKSDEQQTPPLWHKVALIGSWSLLLLMILWKLVR